ncbi:MAG: hypothetical protein H6670_14325 [Anaerolineaceae bacterium]|nr:hypothetical protein [Anaerolineaceae bacterium]
MSYILRGHLCGYLCEDIKFTEDIANVIVRIYRRDIDQDTLDRVVARPSDTITPLTKEQVDAKAKSLLLETRTDDNGRFEIKLGDEQDYNGGPFEVDIVINRAPGQEKEAAEPIQVSLTTLNPQWRQRENDFLAVWDFCIPQRLWCAIRRLLDAWVIIGRLVVCGAEDANGGKIPVPDYTVNAIDNDWIQDDPLGSAVTDANGFFRIDYTSDTFTRTPLTPGFGIRFESFGQSGPDVYFKVRRNSDNALMIDEPEARGLDPDRVNRPPCWCVELCVPIDVEDPDYPFFTQVGVFRLPTDFHSSGAQQGRLNKSILGLGGDGWGLYGNLRLVGLMPQKHPDNNQPMKYRFLYGDTNNPVLPLTTANLVTSIQIGTILTGWTLNPGGWLEPTFDTVGVVPDVSITDFDVNLVPDTNGWVEVPQHANFNPNNNLMSFHTPSVAAPGGNPGPATAGVAAPVGSVKNGKLLFVRLQGIDVGEAGTLYQSAAYPLYVNNWREIGEVDLGELVSDPCSEVTGNAINVRFTVDHEFTRDWSLGITSSASPWTAPTLPSQSNPNPAPASTPAPTTSSRGVFGSYVVDTSTWPSCTYRIILSTYLALTDGDHNEPGSNIDDVMFYIQS